MYPDPSGAAPPQPAGPQPAAAEAETDCGAWGEPAALRAAITAPPDATTLGVMTYNILAGAGPRLDAIEAVIRDGGADLVGIQEALRPDLLPLLAARLGMHHAIARSPSSWHVAALSRWPILETRVYSGPRMLRALLEVLVELPNGTRLRCFVTHLEAAFSRPLAGEPRRLREIALVLERMAEARAAGEPHVLLGDLNSLAPGERLLATAVLRHAMAVETAQRAKGILLVGHPSSDFILPPLARPFRRLLVAASQGGPLGRLVDAAAAAYVPRWVVRRLRRAGYTDCYAALHPDPRTRALTCPQPEVAGRIDYIFASRSLALRLVCCEVLTDTPTRPVKRASDHRPVLARFRLDAGM
jgi:endonuclease/exonuclease/phosphatase family metal-dependent hydrolase